MRLALYQPDIPQNTGTILRMAACFGMPVDIIRPAGFDISGKALRRSVMDYGDGLEVIRHDNWNAFFALVSECTKARIIAVTTKSATNYTDHIFNDHDVLLLGRETAGLPDEVHAACYARITIPMVPGMRSLNVAVAAAMVTGEALRQTGRLDTLGV
ncbi:MAG: tRNA (cytidine/uridine-2'-O-)-methyltransferase [Hyphomicrobiaceae bacterium]|jgi:tRNA (cytidine/uridine-2'-O-)-methyltransferase